MTTRRRDSFPRAALLGAGALLAFVLCAVGAARLTGVSEAGVPADAAVAQSRDLNFEDRADGAVVVRDAASGEAIAELAPGTNGFARALLRGLARERKREALGPEAPFRLALRSDGGLSLEDTANGRFVELGAFGPTNAAVFANFLQAEAAR